MKVAALQMAMSEDETDNIGRAGALVAEAAARGAQLVLLPELWSGPYFPRVVDDTAFALAREPERHPAVQAMRLLAQAHGLVMPVSYFERAGDHFYNSVIVFDADGSELGRYRKSHIPDGAGYHEKHYFRPGDTGFCTLDTRVGRIGVGICWDQWFPECARAMTLAGADLLLYPSAIGSEPLRPEVDTRAAWRRVMVGHAVANTLPLAACNRVGEENGQRFYGASFVCDGYGEIIAELGDTEQGIALAELDLEHWRRERAWFGLLADRRPDLYGELVKHRVTKAR